LTLRRLSLRLLALSLCTFARLLFLAEPLVSVKLLSGNCSKKQNQKNATLFSIGKIENFSEKS
jgi:hypothetical protein